MKIGFRYNSDNRRNVGFLMALDRGAELLISHRPTITTASMILILSASMRVVGQTADVEESESSDGWFQHRDDADHVGPGVDNLSAGGFRILRGDSRQ